MYGLAGRFCWPELGSAELAHVSVVTFGPSVALLILAELSHRCLGPQPGLLGRDGSAPYLIPPAGWPGHVHIAKAEKGENRWTQGLLRPRLENGKPSFPRHPIGQSRSTRPAPIQGEIDFIFWWEKLPSNMASRCRYIDWWRIVDFFLLFKNSIMCSFCLSSISISLGGIPLPHFTGSCPIINHGTWSSPVCHSHGHVAQGGPEFHPEFICRCWGREVTSPPCLPSPPHTYIGTTDLRECGLRAAGAVEGKPG